MATMAVCHQHTVVTVLALKNEQIPSLFCDCVLFSTSSEFAQDWALSASQRGKAQPYPDLREGPSSLGSGSPLVEGGAQKPLSSLHPTTQTLCAHLCHCPGEQLVLEPRGHHPNLCLPFTRASRVSHSALWLCLEAWRSPLLNAFLAAAPQLLDVLLKPGKFWCKSSVWLISVSHPTNSPLIYLPQNRLLLGVGHDVHPVHGATGSLGRRDRGRALLVGAQCWQHQGFGFDLGTGRSHQGWSGGSESSLQHNVWTGCLQKAYCASG